MWTSGAPVGDGAERQLTNAARLPIVFKHIAAMPDVLIEVCLDEQKFVWFMPHSGSRNLRWTWCTG